ncbi:MAG: alginate export family protein [Hyphomonadaceae bacterium]|nr:alginate export family protein [Hyphomonadaceae bacterium]
MISSVYRHGCLAAALALGPLVTPAHAEEPWRLQEAIGAPDWLTLEGDARQLYETVDGQFRAGGSGGDQALSFRTLLRAEADAGRVTFGMEVQDSRIYLDDAGTPLGAGSVNAFDVLQAYADVDFEGAFGMTSANLRLGRQTLGFGSQRVVERTNSSNVIASFTGAYWSSRNARGDEWHVFHVSPVGVRPNDRPSLADNVVSGDEEEWGRRFWGVHYRRANAFGAAFPLTHAEVFLYGLHERDTAATPTPNRDYLQPGFRVHRERARSAWDFDVEASYRTGTRRATSSAADIADLDVEAWTAHAHLGYTFDHPWRWRVSVDHDYATGDETPGDSNFDQYERLFGGRRTDLGYTGIFGPLSPANLDAPGFRVEVRPSARLDAVVAYKAARLESRRDVWVGANVRDASGASGHAIGDLIDARARYWIIPQSVRVEAGVSWLSLGRFAREAPNASRQGDSRVVYVQLTQSF